MDRKTRRIIHKRIDNELNKTETRVLKRKLKEEEKTREEYEKIKYVTDETKKRVKEVRTPTNFRKNVVKKIRKK